MGAAQTDALYIPRASVWHSLPAHCKILATLLFMVAVVTTPPRAMWAFAVYTVLLFVVVALARLPLRLVARRMVIEVPFVLFAVALPFVTGGPRVDVVGISLSVSGLWGAWGVLAKASLGVVASITLASTTTVRDLLHGLQRLRLPRQLVLIASFMVRYADVLTADLARMRIARESRGFSARGLRAWPTLSRTIGALFLRSYERGERVHLAMRSRGFTGVMPAPRDAAVHPTAWGTALALPFAAAVVAVAAVVL